MTTSEPTKNTEDAVKERAIYPTYMYLRDIRKQKRICSDCGREIRGRGDFMFVATERGKYLCRVCEKSRDKQEEKL